MKKKFRLAIVGLGYVGLPLAVEFGKYFETYGYDISTNRIKSLKKFKDPNKEITFKEFSESKNLQFYYNPKILSKADIIIVAVPTPIKKNLKPDLSYLKFASTVVGKFVKNNSIIVFESTVYPGATEEYCIPIIEKISKKIWKKDFFVGYSPERINPGDKIHKINNITKIVSGDTTATVNTLKYIYGHLNKKNIFLAKNIKTAEASKVIENIQRDLNVAFINELSIILDKLKIDTYEVLKAAKTKWNFNHFTPGLVGGHCIGVDPYYLTYKSKSIGYNPRVILAGRELNKKMYLFFYKKVIDFFKLQKKTIKNFKIIVCGLSFKENVSDIRNSQIFNLINIFKKKGFKIYLHDPLVNKKFVYKIHKIKVYKWNEIPRSDMLILAQAHEYYSKFSYKTFLNKIHGRGTVIDLKYLFDPKNILKLGYKYWRP
jgi:UDP-N-acetyl-D-galactosamine dehydrogenase